ncbi:CoA transferase [Bradyrhizobium sp. LHD-71]|uniref:CaiB/BaiF CoA transferase family protein n=1 Tax=Bradyrhizobium sp. LHD-71 TaxID=3072141 RepID=UPI00280CE231|nr:CoA transferase [Bradyrhizobium sp. LHD-71]MDQ8727418.1 CoA transferase [Bradyrhizobium sp. LHD-71]
MQPLQGTRVLDLSRALAGPICALMLGDLGADVIKIEPPGIGDDSRQWPPLQNGESCYFVSFNRNKRSLVMDLGTPEGQEIFRKMVATADVVVENYRAGVMEKWGLGYGQLKTINPRLVYCAISGFGRTGPFADKPATDIYMQAFSGLMSITGEPGGSPMRLGVSVCDLTAGMFASVGVLGALRARDQTGQGQLVETSLLESQMAFISYMFTSFVSTGNVPGPLGSGHISIVPYQAFRTRDGWATLATFNDRLWQRAVMAMGVGHLAEDPRFLTNPLRLANKQELIPLLEAEFLKRDTLEWVNIMDAADVPLAPVNTIDKLVTHPQVVARDMIHVVDHPAAGPISVFGFPLKFSQTPCELRHLPPVLGQQTRDILAEAGLSTDSIEQLLQAGVVRAAATKPAS